MLSDVNVLLNVVGDVHLELEDGDHDVIHAVSSRLSFKVGINMFLKDGLVELNVSEVADDGHELDVQDIGGVPEENNVEHDVVEKGDMLCGVVVDVEDSEDDVEVVDVAQHEVDDVQDEIVVAQLVENESHEVHVRCEMPSAG